MTFILPIQTITCDVLLLLLLYYLLYLHVIGEKNITIYKRILRGYCKNRHTVIELKLKLKLISFFIQQFKNTKHFRLICKIWHMSKNTP